MEIKLKHKKEFIIYFLFILIPFFFIGNYFINNNLILSGEGTFYTFESLFNKENSTYTNGYNYSGINNSLANLNPIIFLLSKIQNQQLASFIFHYSFFFFILLFSYNISKIYSKSIITNFLLSIFVILNLNSLALIQSININTYGTILTCISVLFVLLKFHTNLKKIYIFYGLTILLFNFGLINQPFFISFIILNFCLLLYIKAKNNLSFKQLLKLSIILLFSFLVFNFYWFFNYFLGSIENVLSKYNQFEISNAHWTLENFQNHGYYRSFTKSLALFGNMEEKQVLDFYSKFKNFPMSLVKFIPLGILIYLVTLEINKVKKILLASLISVVLISSSYSTIFGSLFFSINFNNILRNSNEKMLILVLIFYLLIFLEYAKYFKKINIKLLFCTYLTSIFIAVIYNKGIYANTVIFNNNKNYDKYPAVNYVNLSSFQKEFGEISKGYIAIDLTEFDNYNTFYFNSDKTYNSGINPYINNLPASVIKYNYSKIFKLNVEDLDKKYIYDLFGYKIFYKNTNIIENNLKTDLYNLEFKNKIKFKEFSKNTNDHSYKIFISQCALSIFYHKPKCD